MNSNGSAATTRRYPLADRTKQEEEELVDKCERRKEREEKRKKRAGEKGGRKYNYNKEKLPSVSHSLTGGSFLPSLLAWIHPSISVGWLVGWLVDWFRGKKKRPTRRTTHTSSPPAFPPGSCKASAIRSPLLAIGRPVAPIHQQGFPPGPPFLGGPLVAMGISHPLSDEYGAPRGGVLSPEGTPPSSPPPPPSCCSGDEDYLEHEVSRMDTLAGIAIKYGVEISDIKRANSLVSDSQMFAHKTLLIPLPGRPMPSFVRLNGSSERIKRAWAPNHQQNRGVTDSLDSSKCMSDQQHTSLAMSTLQRYYGLNSLKGDDMDHGTEMSLYSKGSIQRISSETLLTSSTAPDAQSTDRSWDPEDPMNGFSATNGASGITSNGATKAKQDGSMRRRQKVEADRLSNTTDTQDDVLADPIKIIKSLLPRPISSIRLNMDTSSPDSTPKGNVSSFLNGFKSVRKSPSAPNFADAENGISMWSSSKWTFNNESFTRPLLDGLPKPASVRRTKAALD